MNLKIRLNKQVRLTIILFISSLLSVILGVGTSVLNTSVLSVEQYGDVRYINNIISFIASFLLFGYFVSGSRLLALSTDEQNSRRIKGAMVVILGITVVVMIVAMIVCYFIHIKYLNVLIAPLFLVSIPICAAPLLQNYANTVFQGDNSIIKLSLGRLLPTALYLVIGYLVYRNFKATSELMLLLQNGCIVVVFLILIVLTYPSFTQLKDSFRNLNKENKSYGFNVYIGSIAGVSLSYIAGITLGVFSENNVDVGMYSLAAALVTPLAMLPAVIGTSYFKRFANQDTMGRKVIVVTLLLSFLSLLLFVIFIGPIVGFLYDESYSNVAGVASFLAIGTTMHGLGDMFNRFLGSHGLGKQLRNGAFICGAVLLIGNIVFVYFWGINGAVLTRILASTSYCLSMVYYYIKHTRTIVK